MQKRLGTLFLCITAVVAMLAMSAVPAFAGDDKGGKEETAKNHQQADQEASETSDRDGDADSDPSTAYDEDSDTNDGTANNVEDDGDNAHPSGKDRSVENGGSNNQGKAESNPDDSKGPQRYEGARGDDKPNGPGGTDLADQDGNNGCGNDDDFNDDNNGHCGPRTKSTPTCPDGSTMPSNGNCNPPTTCPKGGMDSNGKPCDEVKPTCPKGGMDSNGKPCDEVKPTCPKGGMDSNGKPCDEVKGSSCPTNPNVPMNHKECNPPVVCPAGTDMAGNTPGPNGCNIPKNNVCPAGTDMAGLPPGAHGCNVDDLFLTCPAGTDYAGFPMNDLADCNDDVLGRTDEVTPVKSCPAGGPFAGMPVMDEKDCEVPDRVLPNIIRREANPIAGVRNVAGNVAGAVGAVLPFTGAGDLYFAIALGLLLIAAGTVSLKLRNN